MDPSMRLLDIYNSSKHVKELLNFGSDFLLRVLKNDLLRHGRYFICGRWIQF